MRSMSGGRRNRGGMMFTLNNRQQREVLEKALLERLLAMVFARLGTPDGAVEIEIVDDTAITRLNEKFFSRPRPTNVLSFPLQSETVQTAAATSAPPASGREAGGAEVAGVIVVSAETIRRETAGLGYRLEEGLLYYIIHGLLHLIGYEHIDVPSAEAARMEALQEEVFEEVLASAAGTGE